MIHEPKSDMLMFQWVLAFIYLINYLIYFFIYKTYLPRVAPISITNTALHWGPAYLKTTI